MSRFRFSLLSLMGFTGCVAVACAALIYASDVWAAVLFALSILVVLVAALTAMVRRGKARAFGLGASLFGGAYLLLVYSPLLKSPPAGSFTVHYGESTNDHVTLTEGDLPRLWTSAVLEFVYSRIVRRVPFKGDGGNRVVIQERDGLASGGLGGQGQGQFGRVGPVKLLDPPTRAFRHVGHCLFTLLFALCGGLLGCALSGDQHR